MIIKSISKKGKEYKVLFENGDSFLCNIEPLVKANLSKGDFVDNNIISKLSKESRFIDLKSKMLKFITYRKRSEHEIFERFFAQGFESDLIKEAILHFRQLNYIDDDNFAKIFVRELVKVRKYGNKRILMEINKHKLNESMCMDEMDKLYDVILENLKNSITKKIKGLDLEDPLAIKKVVEYHIRKGYEIEDIKSILKPLT